MAAKTEPYPSDLTPKEWRLVQPLLPKTGRLGRPPRYSQREMLNAILYVVRSGCTWRMMPKEFPHWRLVYYYFAKWQALGVWPRLNDALRDRVRQKVGKKKPRPLRSSTARALRWLASPASAASMRARRSADENGISWWTPSD
jgi:putative transposase